MSIFGDIDIASANDNPFFKPDGKYVCKVTKAAVRYSQQNNKGMPLEYTIQEGEKQGKKINESKTIPEVWHVMGYATEEDWQNEVNYKDKIKEDAARNLSFLKLRFKQFGFAPEEMNDIKPEDILSLPLLEIEIKNQGGSERIWDIKLLEGDFS